MSFLTDLHTRLRSARRTREGATHSPDDVPRGTHKTYPRMEHIELPEQGTTRSFSEAVTHRRSAAAFDTRPLALADVGALFSLALSKHTDSLRRMYPSGGGLYPIETYFLAERFEKYERAVFHYDPSAHALEYLWPYEAGSLKEFVVRPERLSFPALIVFTSLWQRSSAKYGNLAYQHALLEAGHMSQNVLLAASALSLAARPMAGFDDEKVSSALDLDPTLEQPVHAVLVGYNHAHESDTAVG